MTTPPLPPATVLTGTATTPATALETTAREAVEQAAAWSRRAYYTPSVRGEASRALTRIYRELEAFGVTAPVRDRLAVGGDPFAGRVLEAITTAHNLQSRQLELTDSDKTDLLTRIVARLPALLGQDVSLLEPPTIIGPDPADRDNHIRAIGRAYIVLSRLPSTPRWGRDGDAPLIVALNRTDGGPEGPWAWDVYPDAGRGGTGQVCSVIAPPPSPGAAMEVADFVAQVLRGDRLLHA